MDIALIGLGHLGTPLGLNLLQAGHTLHIHDLRREAGKRLEQVGARWAASPREAAQAAEVAITVLPTPQAVEAVVAGPHGLLEGLPPGATWIDMSTNDRQVIRRLAELAASQGVHALEAPVSGGIPRAHDGEITVLVGGDPALFQRFRPLLEAVGGQILYLGPLGSASVAKLITNMLAFVHLWVLGEGLMLGKLAGLDLGALFQAILASCGNSFVAETEGPPILDGTYDYGFTMALAAKDAHLVYELAREVGMPLEVSGLVQQIFTRGRRRYGDQAWSTQIVKLLEDDLGVDLRAARPEGSTAFSPLHGYG